MSEEDLGEVVKRRVEAEIKAVRVSAETEMKERLQGIEKEFDRTYRRKILAVSAAIGALLVAGAMTSTATATRKANEAVIAFQNAIIERQKSIMQTEDTVTLLVGKVTDATNKVSKAETELGIASTKLKVAEDDLRTVEGKLKEGEQNLRSTTSGLDQARRDYGGLAAKLRGAR